jgi:raffinose/stachyose/melibiose transport system permease protein
LLVLAALALLPFVSIALVALYPPSQLPSGFSLPHSLYFGNFARAWRFPAGTFAALFRSSAVVAVGVVVLGTLTCIFTGYAFGLMEFRFKRVLQYIFMVGLVLPFETTVIPLYYEERSLRIVNTYPGLILPEAALFLSFGTLWMRGYFRSAPKALTEAARLDGCNSWQVLWRVLVPNARPQVTTMAVLFFTWSWNEFLLVLVLAQASNVQTAPAGLALFNGEYNTDTSGMAAAALMVSAPVLVVYILLQRQFIRGATAGSVKG